MTITNPYTVTAVNTAIGAIGSTLTFAPGAVGAASITTNSLTPNSLEVRGDIDVRGGDVKIDGVSVKTLLEGVSARLAILIPDPNKLEKYEALRLAYERFKFLEALLGAEDGD